MDFSLRESINSDFGELNPFLRVYEGQWIESTIRILEKEEEEYGEQWTVRIFTVPKALLSLDKEAYIPQLVAIGPYHQKRLDLYQMMRYKISSAKRIQKLLRTRRIRYVVEHFYELEYRIRACYDRFADYGSEALAWMMAIDASFLLEYLQIYTKGVAFTEVPYDMSHLFNCTGRKSGHQIILRDIIMLENQIPLFVLKEFLCFCQLENPEELFVEMLKAIYKVLSPNKSMDNFPSCKEELFERAHLVELLYCTLVPSLNREEMVVIEIGNKEEEKHASEDHRGWKRALNLFPSKLPCLLSALSKLLSITVKLPWKIFKRITLNSRGNMLENLAALAKEVAEVVDIVDTNATPMVDEIVIPRVTELANVGIKFSPAKGGLNAIKFDCHSATVLLPVIVMDESSNVVLKNLVAYEASVAPKMMALSRYIELMNGIINTEEDVKFLKEAGIILNHLKSDMEVANLWNGMSKSVKTTKFPILEDTIAGINAYYSAILQVKAQRIMKKCVYRSWKCLIFCAANIFLLLTTVQAICSVYQCKRLIN